MRVSNCDLLLVLYLQHRNNWWKQSEKGKEISCLMSIITSLEIDHCCFQRPHPYAMHVQTGVNSCPTNDWHLIFNDVPQYDLVLFCTTPIICMSIRFLFSAERFRKWAVPWHLSLSALVVLTCVCYTQPGHSFFYPRLLSWVWSSRGLWGGGGTHPGFGYPLQNGPRELWLSTRSRLEKGGLSLTQVLSAGGL